MNIFQYLGLDENHRKLSNKVTQLVKHWDEVPESRKKGKRYGVQVKKDGVCAITIIHNGDVQIFSRTGKLFTNTEFIKSQIRDCHLRDGAYLGELWVPKLSASLEVWSGIVNPNRNKVLSREQYDITQQAKMSFFDVVSIASFIEGRSDTLAVRRHANLSERIDAIPFEAQKYVECLPLYKIGMADIPAFLEDVVKVGEEGIVIRDLDAGWEAGHKGWRVMKLVRGVDYDLRCIGWEEGTGKYKEKVANLIFTWKGGKEIKCMLGKGWTHEDAANMYKHAKDGVGCVYDPENPVGHIFQVYALEESSKGKLRLPKVGEWRHDKEIGDI